MDLNAEFHKETGRQADDGYRYNDYYVEWLEERCEKKLIEWITKLYNDGNCSIEFYDRFISQLNE